MIGPTAQLVALACHFNGRARGLPTASFFPSNSTCKFCEQIHFIRQPHSWLGRRTDWTITERTPDEWLAHEARPGRSAIVAHQRTDDPRISDRRYAGFIGGGGRWRLSITNEGRMDVWSANWEVGDPKASDQRVWRVRYSLVAENLKLVLPPLRSPVAMIPVLRQALSEVLAFSEEHRIDNFAGNFRKAIECLSADDPFALVYHKDLAPVELLDLSAQQVLAACQAAWVFGGMGSWNDMGFTGQEQSRYERLSDTLFAVLNEAIPASANSGADFGKSPSKV